MNIVYSLPTPSDLNSAKVTGVTVGIVTNINDPDKKGRIKVKYVLWDTAQESDWIRVAAPMAGPERGIFFLPEVNDEVLLAFQHGNVEEPIVIGALWNGKDKIPEANAIADGKVNIRKFKTRIGHEVILNDTQGKESIELHTPKGKKLVLDDANKKIEVKDDNAQNTLTIDNGANSIELKAGSKVTLKVNSCVIEINGSNISINAPAGNLKISANQIDIQATTALKLNANATLDVKAGGMVNIKGAMVKIN